jgi:RNA polymerase sigma factor (sigma-70 family)
MSPGISTRLLATQSDERLLALVRDGHERAFEALVNRYRRPLLGYCRRMSLSEARAEDVLQQALLKTWIALRDGAEVRDIKAWLYRVVHNTAVNAVRDAAHDRDRLADPTLRAGIGQADLERGLVVREALAEVAALPRLQREAIVRTAVGGHSHEQVASDLGITDGAVRGLLYRARATLRTATTAVTPVSWLGWFAGRAEQSAPASERLSELAAGGTAGLGGLLLKGAVVAVTAGTLLTGAAVVRLQASHARHEHAATAPSHGASAAVRDVWTKSTATASAAIAPVRHERSGSRRGAVRVEIGRARRPSGGTSSPRRPAVSAPAHRPAAVPHTATPAPSAPVSSTQGNGTPSSSGPAPGGSSGQTQAGSSGSGAGGASQGGPVGTAAGSSSSSSSETASGTGAGDAPAQSESESSGGSTPSGESSGTQSGTGTSESSGGTQSGGLVGTVVHEVGSLVEHILG